VKLSENGNDARAAANGRGAKVDGIDYKQGAVEYLSKIPEERRHHLRTKPFYNLANKPARYRNAGMDEDTHRHFCDFANIAVTLALEPGSSILDVGCGSGWLSEYFARLGYVVKGIDISPDLIEMSRERVARVPYGADHETPLRCEFEIHDVEMSALDEPFDAIICYDSLHHFQDEKAVIQNVAKMMNVGGALFILEGDRPPAGSSSEEELHQVMNEFGTLESPFDYEYLRQLLEENGFAITGDYVSVNGLFPREAMEHDRLQLSNLGANYHYLACKKVASGAHASTVPDSRQPELLRAEYSLLASAPGVVEAFTSLELKIQIRNTGDTLWLAGSEPRSGIVMPAIRIIDGKNAVISEVHGEPLLPHAVAPGETIMVRVSVRVPSRPGPYTLKFDLVAQHISWFEQHGTIPLTVPFEVSA
jgi:SAM-dependent methyltransferase